MRLIDADEIYKDIIQNEDLAMDRVANTNATIGGRINPMYIRYCAQLDERTIFKHMIADAPTVDAVPVKHGKWIEYPTADGMNQCSACGVLRFGESYYCPNCGADMRTKETDCDYERAVEQLEHDMLYEPTFNQDDGSM